MKHAIPVILDTDIGGDIDDTWALGMMLNAPELDPKLVLTCTADTVYRAKLSCKLLQGAGRSDIPVGVGLRFASDGPRERQSNWVGGYRLEDYPGIVHEDGIAAAIELIEKSDGLTIICIGPLTNIAEICRRRPDLAPKCRIVAMMGSLWRSHRGEEGAIAEFNVAMDAAAAQAVFAAPWRNVTITPLDSCGTVVLRNGLYRQVIDSDKPVPGLIAENYRVWLGGNVAKWESESSILYDTVAVYLAFADELLEMRKLKLIIDDEGFTRIDESGREVDAAIGWKQEAAFNELLVSYLLA